MSPTDRPDDQPTLHAETWGAGTETARAALPLVLLHGFGGGAFIWRPLAASLAAGRAVIAYDLPGHGGSLAGPGVGGAGAMAKAILADLDRRGIGAVHAAGHSMGGAVAAIMAMRAPDRIRSLTLVAPGGFGPGINRRLLERYARACDAETMRAVLEAMSGWAAPIEDPIIAGLVAMRRIPGAVDTLLRIVEAMFPDPAEPLRQGTIPRAALAAFAMPVKVLWGTADNVLPVENVRALPPRFGVHLFPGAGHMLVEECRDDVAALIAETVRAGG